MIFVIKLDVIGYESRVPELSDVKEVSISNNVNSYYDDLDFEGMTSLEDQSNMKAIQGLHERIIQYGEDDRFNEST